MSLDQKSALSRSEFLRLAAAGAGGLGLAALGGCAGKPSETGVAGHVVVIMHGPADPDRAFLGLDVAKSLPPKGDNHVLFALEGGLLCKKGENVSSKMHPETTLASFLEMIRGNGVSLAI